MSDITADTLQSATTESTLEQTTALSLREIATQTFAAYYSGLNPDTTVDVYQLMLRKMEPVLLKATLEFTTENQSQSAIVLGISRGTCRKLLKQYSMLKRGASQNREVENTGGPLADVLSQSVNQTVRAYYKNVDMFSTTGVYDMVLAEVEEPLLIATLAFTHQNQSRTAIVLGLSRGTVRKLIKQYGLQ